jgi:hypothetical protein
VALVFLSARDIDRRERAIQLVATGVGFLAFTGGVWLVTWANPFVIWWWNQKNHARFYVEYRRTYLAWVAVNPVELAVALGLPATVWAVVAGVWPRQAPRVSVATIAVLIVLTVSGKNLSEVARLWLPFMPALLVAGGYAMHRAGAGPAEIAGTVALIGAETLGLQAAIQVVYPV